MGKTWLTAIFVLVTGCHICGYAESDFELDGHVKYLQTVLVPDTGDDWLLSAEPRARLELSWYPGSVVSFRVGVQNRLIVGEFVEDLFNFRQLLDEGDRLLDMSWNIVEGNSYVLNVMVDRAYAAVDIDPVRLRLGRMRVNWGLNLVWNPNDLFNAESFFDFATEVAPGMDGVELTVYLGPTSSVQMVAEARSEIDSTNFAALYRFNTWGYDFQVLGGMVASDIVIGGGWTGSIGGAAFRGEATYFHPRPDFGSEWGQLVASVSSDYTFGNSLYIQGSVLLNSTGTTGKAGTTEAVIREELSVKDLTPALGSLFGQVRYPFTPLFQGDLATIVNPFDGSFVVLPTLSYSLTQTIDLLAGGQLFFGRDGTEFGNIGHIGYGWLLWSF
ncbi:MAG: hypothetical protein GF331_22410 [Chitinivibrionales bacterium]|nr:hypothetical protein [Chitinivibrionales bacterium]